MVNIGGKGKGSYNEYAKRYYVKHKEEISKKRKIQRKEFQAWKKEKGD